MSLPSTSSVAGLPADLMDQVGRPVDPDNPDDVHRASVGPFEIVLRRDCHGHLRRAEIAFPGPIRQDVRQRVADAGWQVVAPGELELLDIPGVAKVYLLSERLSIVFRISVARAEIAGLVSRCLGVRAEETPASRAR